MDTTTTHYISYDADTLWQNMMAAYVSAGGDLLKPGDEKEMLLRGVQQVVLQLFGQVDSALKLGTLTYAEGEYLDLYGEQRGCTRIPAAAAQATVSVVFASSGVSLTIPAGTALTADGKYMYLLKEAITQSGTAQTVTAYLIASETGESGNALTVGTTLNFMTPYSAVTSVTCTVAASGGQDEEDDDSYRERIRQYGLTNLTTGPKSQYESVAKNVSSIITDAEAVNGGAGVVNVYLLLSDTTSSASIITAVTEALSADDVRPLTDSVSVALATGLSYTLNVNYYPPAAGGISSAVTAAAAEYKDWQDTQIGLAFNPDKLKALLFQAGATRVEWGTGSNFNGGSVAYTTIASNQYCSGTINLTEVST